jgi:hypothetical protein
MCILSRVMGIERFRLFPHSKESSNWILCDWIFNDLIVDWITSNCYYIWSLDILKGLWLFILCIHYAEWLSDWIFNDLIAESIDNTHETWHVCKILVPVHFPPHYLFKPPKVTWSRDVSHLGTRPSRTFNNFAFSGTIDYVCLDR